MPMEVMRLFLSPIRFNTHQRNNYDAWLSFFSIFVKLAKKIPVKTGII